jgi:hypothetical protein
VHWAKPAAHVAALAALTHCRATPALADLTADHADHLAAFRAVPVLVKGHVSPSSELTRCSGNVILDQPRIRRISSLLPSAIHRSVTVRSALTCGTTNLTAVVAMMTPELARAAEDRATSGSYLHVSLWLQRLVVLAALVDSHVPGFSQRQVDLLVDWPCVADYCDNVRVEIVESLNWISGWHLAARVKLA